MMKNKKMIYSLLENGGLIIVSLIFIIPFLWMFGTSLKSYSEAMAPTLSFFGEKILFKNYLEVFSEMNYLHYLKNSVLVSMIIVIGRLFVCIPAAYYLARTEFKYKKIIMGILLLNLIVPAQIVFLPIYKIISRLGLLDTYAGLTIIHFYSAYAIFFLYQVIKKVPNETIEAAKLDKTSEFGIIKDIMIPYAKPMIITIAVFTFIDSWNDYFWPFLLTMTNDVRTLPVALKSMTEVNDGMIQWQLVMAANMLVLLPILIIYIIANKKIKNAFTYDGIK